MLTIGLDLHWKSSTFCILDSQGQQVKTQTVRGQPQQVLGALERVAEPFQITYEASTGYGWIFEKLSALANCNRVVVAHPGELRLIFGSKRKNDRLDAQKLAKLLYLDALPSVHVPNLDVRQWRSLIEFRTRLIGDRTRIKNRIRALLRTYGLSKPKQIDGWWSKACRLWLTGLVWPSAYAGLQRDLLLEQLASLDRQIAKLTTSLDQIGKRHPAVQLLRTIPGVGPRTAECIVAYIDDPHRFERVSQIGAYFGLIPRQDASAQVNRLGHITREGPATARKLLVEAVWIGIRHDDHLRDYFDRIHGGHKGRRKIALIATAHHLLRCMLAMLKTGQDWQPPRGGGSTMTQSSVCQATNN